MAIDYAVITGTKLVPGTSFGMQGTLYAYPQTDGYRLTFDADPEMNGPVQATTTAAGVFTINIPINSEQQDTLFWRFIFEPTDRHAGVALQNVDGTTQVTASADYDDLDLTAQPIVIDPDAAADIATNAAAVLGVVATNDGIMAAALADTDSASGAYINSVSPIAFGAVGNDSTDDTADLQSAINAGAAFGAAIDGRGLTYKTTDNLDVPAGTTLQNATIHCTGTGKKILNVTGDNVTLRNVSIIGRHATPTAADVEYGIWVNGASAASPIRGLLIERCSVELVGMYGIALQHTNGFRILNCDLGDLGYTGIGTLSALNGLIEGCRIEDILTDTLFSFDGYGIHTSRSAEIDSLVTSPRSENITIRGNIVRNVDWEGIDTHGGERITVEGNFILGCKVGIAMVGADGAGNITIYGPRQFVLKGNVIDSLVTDGSAAAGISIAGAPGATAADPAVEYATGTITGNTIRNHGTETDDLTGGMRLRNTRGLVVSGNQIEQPAPFGICLYYDNRGVTITGNTVVDAWSSSVSTAGAIGVRSNNNTGTISGNALITGSKSATHVNKAGIRNTGTGSALALGVNHFTAATTPFSDSSGGGTSTFLTPVLAPAGAVGTPGLSFGDDPDCGFYRIGANDVGFAMGGANKLRFFTTSMDLADGYNMFFGGTTGSQIGQSAAAKLAFHGATPIVRVAGTPAAATDLATVITLANFLRTALKATGGKGLIAD